MKRLSVLCLLIPLLFAPGGAVAKLYSEAQIAALRSFKSVEAETLYSRFVIRFLPTEYQSRASEITLEFPDSLASPLMIETDVASKTITLPLATMRFVDDMILLRSWFDQAGCSDSATLAQLSYLTELFVYDADVGPPLEAFAIDRDVALGSDPNFNTLVSLSQTSTLVFLMAQKTAHILNDHDLNAIGLRAEKQEIAADAFAMNQFLRMEDVPWGVTSLMQLLLFTDPMQNARDTIHHPMTTDRLEAMLRRLTLDADVHATAYPNYDGLADDLRSLASPEAWALFLDIWSERDLQEMTLDNSRFQMPKSEWSSVCPTPTPSPAQN